jgi:uncharacterized protein (DUF1330 family)
MKEKNMSTLIIVDLTPTDTEKLGVYSARAGETLKAYGGEFLAKGPIESLHGDAPFSTKVVIQFPDRDSAVNWYQSDAYQAIIPIRDQGMNSQFHLVG